MARKTLTRMEISHTLARKLGISYQHAREVLDTFLENMIHVLEQEEGVKLSRFGCFASHHKNQRMGKNPKTGEAAIITPRNVVSFKASMALKKAAANKQRMKL